jgi:hypothetical protein
VLLLAGFRWNAWGASSDGFFAASQADTEGLVFGRIAWSREQGLASSGGLLGFVGTGPALVSFDSVDLWLSHRYEGQREAFRGEVPVRSFSPYFSHNGLQGWAYATLDFLLRPLAAGRREEVFRVLTAATFALAGSLLIFYLWLETGAAAAFGAFLVLVSSPWLAALGRNLYWNLWVFLLPALAIGAWLAYARREASWRFAAVAYGALLARCLCGYEYATAWAAMAAAPVVYFAVRDAWPARMFAARIGLFVLAGIGAFLTSLGLLTFQIAAVTGSAGDAAGHLRLAVARRTSGETAGMSPLYAEGLRANASDVLRSYFADPYDRQAERARVPIVRWARSRSYGALCLAVLAAALWAALRSSGGNRRPLALAAAAACAWAGIVAWLVVFKAHSFLHAHVNPVMWSLFFLPLGAALVAWAIFDAARIAARRLFRASSGSGADTHSA